MAPEGARLSVRSGALKARVSKDLSFGNTDSGSANKFSIGEIPTAHNRNDVTGLDTFGFLICDGLMQFWIEGVAGFWGNGRDTRMIEAGFELTQTHAHSFQELFGVATAMLERKEQIVDGLGYRFNSV